jgi:hypothetical protein
MKLAAFGGVLVFLASGCKSPQPESAAVPVPEAAEAAEAAEAPAAAAAGEVKDQAQAKPEAPPKARAVTAEIQQGIEKHIAEKSKKDGGLFRLPYKDRELKLKLVRVHIEYLASLGPERNFACVDLVDTDGEVYDVDFFLEGPPNQMAVTETTVHKVNGKPFYAWEQNKEDKTWHRVPMDKASARLKGVIEEKDSFEFTYQVTLPRLEMDARMWLPLPVTDSFQKVQTLAIKAPGKQTQIDDGAHKNKVLLLELGPQHSGQQVEMRFAVERIEKPSYAEPLKDPAPYLKSDRLVPITDEFRQLAQEAIKGKETDLMKGRALYDHVMDRMSYKKVGDKYGKGDAVYACDSKTGNCSDYHSYFIAVARSVGIPARFAVGAAIPSARDEGGISGYHCWAEFYADGKWWPIDVSEGDKYSSLSSYYFGHHPANRIELSRGRDLVLSPGPQSGPINFLAHPTLEVGGKHVRTKAKFSFQRRKTM